MSNYTGWTTVGGAQRGPATASFENMIDQPCVLEFSQLSKDRGLYPYHIDTLKRSQKYGPQELEWEVIFSGSWSECYEQLQNMEPEKSIFDEDYRVHAPRLNQNWRPPHPPKPDSEPDPEISINYYAGYVYVLKGNNLYKIGRTTGLPTKRTAEYSPKLPFETELVVVIKTDDCFKLEKELHARFKSKHVRGEWFNLTPKDLKCLTGLSKKASARRKQ